MMSGKLEERSMSMRENNELEVSTLRARYILDVSLSSSILSVRRYYPNCQAVRVHY